MKTLLACSALLLIASCQTTSAVPRPATIDPALLADLNADQRAAIDEARLAREAAADALAGAKRNCDLAKERIDITKADLDVSRAQVERAKETTDLGRKGTNEDLAAAKGNVDKAKDELAAKQQLLDVRKYQVELAKAEVEVHEQRLQLADATLELTKARAVAGIDRPSAKSIDIASHEAVVRQQQTDLEVAEVKARAAEKEVQVVAADYETKYGEIERGDRVHQR